LTCRLFKSSGTVQIDSEPLQYKIDPEQHRQSGTPHEIHSAGALSAIRKGLSGWLVSGAALEGPQPQIFQYYGMKIIISLGFQLLQCLQVGEMSLACQEHEAESNAQTA